MVVLVLGRKNLNETCISQEHILDIYISLVCSLSLPSFVVGIYSSMDYFNKQLPTHLLLSRLNRYRK